MPRATYRPPTPAKTPAQAISAARKAARALKRAPRKDNPDAHMPGDLEIAASPGLAADLAATALQPGTPDPVKALLAAAAAAGLDPLFAEALATRLFRSPEFVATGRKLTDEHLVSALDDKIRDLVAHIDPVVMSRMSGKDLVVSAAVLIDKRQLLKGQPTAIVSTEARKNLDELLPAVMKEAERRGLAFPNRPMIDITPSRPKATA